MLWRNPFYVGIVLERRGGHSNSAAEGSRFFWAVCPRGSVDTLNKFWAVLSRKSALKPGGGGAGGGAPYNRMATYKTYGSG